MKAPLDDWLYATVVLIYAKFICMKGEGGFCCRKIRGRKLNSPKKIIISLQKKFQQTEMYGRYANYSNIYFYHFTYLQFSYWSGSLQKKTGITTLITLRFHKIWLPIKSISSKRAEHLSRNSLIDYFHGTIFPFSVHSTQKRRKSLIIWFSKLI